jgi:hypothetical protein
MGAKADFADLDKIFPDAVLHQPTQAALEPLR